MTTTTRTLKSLQDAARTFRTKNHVSYLAEALQCLRDVEDPVAALRLLHAMWSSPFTSRAGPREALNGVGCWLEDRLYREPAAAYDAIAWELGWLRRFAATAAAARDNEASHRPDRRENEPGRSRGPLTPEFGGRIAAIEKRRAKTSAEQRQLQLARAAPPPPSPPPPPTQLPRIFKASFVDFVEARQARQTARKRAKSGRPAKERWLDLRPVDPRLWPLATGLVCGVLSTQGFDELFEAEQQTFYVTAFEAREEKKVVTAVAPQPPSAGEASPTLASS